MEMQSGLNCIDFVRDRLQFYFLFRSCIRPSVLGILSHKENTFLFSAKAACQEADFLLQLSIDAKQKSFKAYLPVNGFFLVLCVCVRAAPPQKHWL